MDRMHVDAARTAQPEKIRFILRLTAFVFQLTLIIGLLLWWFLSDPLERSRNLWIFFLYSFPAGFIVATVPHEPVLLYFAKYYPPHVVALVAIAGTSLTEALNYSVFKFVVDLKLFNKIQYNLVVNKTIALFNKAPFAALWIAGFTPIPFFPFRFLVVLAHYPLLKYVLAVILSRTSRYYLLAMLGQAIKIPDFYLLLLIFVGIVAAYLPFIKNSLRNKRKRERAGIDD